MSGINSQCWMMDACDSPSIRSGMLCDEGNMAIIIRSAIATIDMFSMSAPRQILSFTTLPIQTQAPCCFLSIALVSPMRVIVLTIPATILMAKV